MKIQYQLLLLLFTILNLSCHSDKTVTCQTIVHKGKQYDICTYNPKKEKIAFYTKDEKGKILKNFKNLKGYLKRQKKELKFAINGGIYDKGNIPMGLYVENGVEQSKIDARKGKGNFYLRPSGVLILYKDGTPTVMRTKDFIKKGKKTNMQYALQSGPILCYDDKIHPKFRKKSEHKYTRSGVGVNADGNLVFAISKRAVNLHSFASLYQKRLNCSNALYLDGAICKMYAPSIYRKKLNGNLAAMIAVVE